MEVVNEIEGDYNSSKENVNKFNGMSLGADVTIKVLNQSYKILKENLYKENPNFDQNKIEATIH